MQYSHLMNRTAKLFLPVMCLIVLSMSSCDTDKDADDVTIELEPFYKLARTAVCADRTNRLFVIDDAYVFWWREGNCSDASYAYVLFDDAPNNVVCSLSDSIAGPQRTCDPEYEELFDTITESLGETNLGLDSEYVVVEVTE